MPHTGSSSSQSEPSKPAPTSENDIQPGSASISVSRSSSRRKGKSNVLKPDSLEPPSKSKDLNERIRAFKRNVAKLHKAHESMVARAAELDQRERQLLDREAALLAQVAEAADITPPPAADRERVDTHDAELESLRAELAQHEATLDQRAHGLDQREEALDEREESLGQREDGIDQREQAINQRSEQLDAREAELASAAPTTSQSAEYTDLESWRAELAQQANDLEQRQAALESLAQSLQPDLDKLEAERKAFRAEHGRAKGALTRRENKIEAEEQQLDEREGELLAVREELDQHQNELDEQSNAMNDREQALQARSALIEQQVADLERRTADLLNFESLLDQREQDLLLRDNMLNQLADTLDARKDQLQNTRQRLELRKARVSYLRRQLDRVSRRLRGKRRRFKPGKSSTLSIGPDDNEERHDSASPAPPNSEPIQSNAAIQQMAAPSNAPTIADATEQLDDDDRESDPLTPRERQALIVTTIIAALLGAIGVTSYLLAGAMTHPTWRATLIVRSDALPNRSALTGDEITHAMNYLTTRGYQPASDAAGFARLLDEKMTATRTEQGTVLAFDHQNAELARVTLQGLQHAIQQHRGGPAMIVSAAATHPDPHDDPQWRITYVLMALGTLIALAVFIVTRQLSRGRGSGE